MSTQDDALGVKEEVMEGPLVVFPTGRGRCVYEIARVLTPG